MGAFCCHGVARTITAGRAPSSGSLHQKLLFCTVVKTETPMKHALRQHYQPKINRVPQWLWRIWLWL
jgi:hypothetical protein